MIVNIQTTFNKPVAVISVATTFTVTASPTGLLSTKNTSSEPPLSVTSRASPDPSSDSSETTAIDNEINALSTSVYYLLLQ